MSKRIKLKPSEWIQFYIAPLTFFAMALIEVQCFLFNENYQFGSAVSIFSLIFILTAIFTFWRCWLNTFYKRFKTGLSNDEFERVVNATALEFNGTVHKIDNKRTKIMIDNSEFMISSRDFLIIERNEDIISINNIPDFSTGRGSGFSFFANNEYINKFRDIAVQVKKGEDVELQIRENKKRQVEEFWEEKEWTIFKIIQRVVIYGILMILLLFFLMIFLNEPSLPLLLAFFPLGVIGYYFIESDSKILEEKRKRKRKAHNKN